MAQNWLIRISSWSKVINRELLSSAQAAKLLGVSLRTIQLWVEQGILAAWKTPGGHRRIPRDSIQKLLDEQHAQVAGQIQQPKKVKKAVKPLKLLIVEDEGHLRKLYRKYLEHLKLPLEVHTADGGFQGLIMMGELKPDLLMTDLMMPGMNGSEMIREIRQKHYLDDDRIIVVTAMDGSAEEVQSLKNSGVRVLHKPLLLEDLMEVLGEKLTLTAAVRPQA